MRCAPPASVWTTIVILDTPGVSLCPTASEMILKSAPAKQRRDAIQHARPILDVNGKICIVMGLRRYTSAPVSTIGLGRRIIACRSAPAGTIG